MKRILLMMTVGFFLCSNAYGDSITMTTYYPAPFLAVDQLRLVPKAAVGGTACDVGTMYYNNTANRIEYCRDDGADGEWGLFQGIWTQGIDGGSNPVVYPTDADPALFVGIGTATPGAKLHLAQDGGIIAKGTFNAGVLAPVPDANPTFLWYPRKAALRAGVGGIGFWDDINIGIYSIAFGNQNRASGSFTTIAGGQNNQALGIGVSIGGGSNNVSSAGDYSTIGGGQLNSTSEAYATVGGGFTNAVDGQYATIGGGANNSMAPATTAATIAGGRHNLAEGIYSFVGGGGGPLVANRNISRGSYSVVGGGTGNVATPVYSAITGGEINLISGGAATHSFIGGGQSNLIDGTGTHKTISGGQGNQIILSSAHATIGGGRSNVIGVGGVGPYHHSVIAGGGDNTIGRYYSFIGGGQNNDVSNWYDVVGGGNNNDIDGVYSFIGGGFGNSIGVSFPEYAAIVGGESNTCNYNHCFVGGGQGNSVGDEYAVVGGGLNNTASGEKSFIGGGQGNQAWFLYDTVAGGWGNRAEGGRGAIGGGQGNRISGVWWNTIGGGNTNLIDNSNNSTISGGTNNTIQWPASEATIGGGEGNLVNEDFATISGGRDNSAGGIASVVPGGEENDALGDYSWAGGRHTNVTGDRTFVWNYHATVDQALTQNDRFLIFPTWAAGRVGIGTTNPLAKLHINGDLRIATINSVSSSGSYTLKWNSGTEAVGRDVAELFESSEEVEVGDLLVIDESQEIKLKKSQRPYDTAVIGVVSAAPAILFEGSALHMAPEPFAFKKGSKPPVALAGRVFCKVSLEGGPIKPGDLLVTSSTPGHAMKATDQGRLNGTIAAKALQTFTGGEDGAATGMILVIITLH